MFVFFLFPSFSLFFSFFFYYYYYHVVLALQLFRLIGSQTQAKIQQRGSWVYREFLGNLSKNLKPIFRQRV